MISLSFGLLLRLCFSFSFSFTLSQSHKQTIVRMREILIKRRKRAQAINAGRTESNKWENERE